MRVRIGTSGYQYAFWRGNFYPERCKEADMLSEYGQRLDTVEVNNTFYRMPKPAVLERWAGQVPDDFHFALKASRRITHHRRLKETGDNVSYLLSSSAQVLGAKLGPVLFQLPPNLRKDLPRLETFLSGLPQGVRVTMEFRHPSWFDAEVYARLRDGGVALCISDEGEGEAATPFVATTGFGYLRLRREQYQREGLSQVLGDIRAQAWSEAYVYFKHEEGAPALAAELKSLL